MSVRPAQRADLDALLALLSQLHEDEPPLRVTPELAGTYERMLATPGRTILVAEQDRDGAGGLLGTVDMRVSDNLTHGGRPWVDVDKVVVDRCHRRQGVGAALLAEAIRLAREAGCYKLQLISREEAHAFYEANDFRPSGPGLRLAL